MPTKDLRKMMSTYLIALIIAGSIMATPTPCALANTGYEQQVEWGNYTQQEIDEGWWYSSARQYRPLDGYVFDADWEYLSTLSEPELWPFHYYCFDDQYDRYKNYAYYANVYPDVWVLCRKENTATKGYLINHNQNDEILITGSDITNLIPTFLTTADAKKGAALFRYVPGKMDRIDYNALKPSNQETCVLFTAPDDLTLRVENLESYDRDTAIGLFDMAGNQIFSRHSSDPHYYIDDVDDVNDRSYSALSFDVQKGHTYQLRFYNKGADYEAELGMFYIKEAPKTTSKTKAIEEGKWYLNTMNEWAFNRTIYSLNSPPRVQVPEEKYYKVRRAKCIRITLTTESTIKISLHCPLYDRFNIQGTLVYMNAFQKSSLDKGNTSEYATNYKFSDTPYLDKNGNYSWTVRLPAGNYYISLPYDRCTDLAYRYDIIEEHEIPLNKEWDGGLKVTSCKHNTQKIKGTVPCDGLNTVVVCQYDGKTYITEADSSGRFTIKTPTLAEGKKIKIWFVIEMGYRMFQRCSTKTFTIK